MVNKMIDKANECGNSFGIPNIPKPSKRAMEIGNNVNKIAGASLILYGLISNKKLPAVIGIASIIANKMVYDKTK